MNFKSLQLHHYPESQFGGFTRCDGTVAFFVRVRALLRPGAVVIDAGCGRGEWFDSQSEDGCLRDLRTTGAHVLGVDVDLDGTANLSIDEFRLITADRWPIETHTADLVIADWVLEHLDDPSAFLQEAVRVLKPGGVFCARTPNKYGYPALVSRMVPNRLHARVVAKVQDRREQRDVFPTRYKANSQRALTKALREAGLAGAVYPHNPEPTYLSFSPLAYTAGVYYQRYAPLKLSMTLLAFGRTSDAGAR